MPYTDPLASLPQATCGGGSDLNITGGPNPPGCYNGLSAAGSYTINLQGGTYTFAGDLNLSGTGTITGAGVTIFMGAAGALTIGPNTIMTLSAPASGTYNGILFAQNSTNPSPANIAIGPTSNLQGILYFPDASLTVTATSPTQTLYTDFIANSLTFSGTGPLIFKDYATAPGVTSPIPSAVLVE